MIPSVDEILLITIRGKAISFDKSSSQEPPANGSFICVQTLLRLGKERLMTLLEADLHYP